MLPEGVRHHSGHIAAESVDACVAHPPIHFCSHRVDQKRGVIIQIGHVGPSRFAAVVSDGFHRIAAVLIARVEIVVRFYPRVVPGTVVGDPIEQYMHTQCVCLVHDGFKIFNGSKSWVDRCVILDGIIAAELAFAVALANRLDGHEPKDIHVHLCQAREVLLKGIQGSFRRVLTDVDLINISVFRPLWKLRYFHGWSCFLYRFQGGTSCQSQYCA